MFSSYFVWVLCVLWCFDVYMQVLNVDLCGIVGEVIEKREVFGEVFNGDCMVEVLYELRFRVDKEMKIFCEKIFIKDDIKKF